MSNKKSLMNRDSNMELLRIVAMFLVLVVHADFFTLGIPTYEESINDVLPTISRFFFQCLSIGCVDVFVLISGWFGIRPNLKSFLSFIFQCLFFLCGVYFVCLIAGYASFTLTGILECLVMTKHNWFIKSYVFLYILAPVLNSFVDQASEKDLRYVLIAFYVFQIIYGWITSSAQFFVSGYSTTSFIGLYLLARYIRIYNPRIARLKRWKDLSFFMVIVFVYTFITYLLCRFNAYEQFPPLHARMFSYINPIIIMSALFLLLFFTKLKIHNVWINKVAVSCFAVFLLHQNIHIIPLYKKIILNLYDGFSGLLCLLIILVFLLALFIIAVLIDRVRILCWDIMVSHLRKKSSVL